MNLRQLGEDRLIAQLVAPLRARGDVRVGPGDDCAVVGLRGAKEWLLLKTDCVVEGVHFLPNEKPFAIGWKAMARTLSDFAAMSGLPRWALVTLVLPADRGSRWPNELYRGMRAVADRFDVAIVGGETSATNGAAVISISAVGVVEKTRCVFRRGGRHGDALFVTGRLGGSLGKKHLRFLPRIDEARWLTRNFPLHAMMDLSDGLGADLPRLAKASGLDFEIDAAAIPRTRGCSLDQAINDGEDYELLFAVSPHDSANLQTRWRRKFRDLPLTPIGRLNRKSQITNRKFFRGYVHFQ